MVSDSEYIVDATASSSRNYEWIAMKSLISAHEHTMQSLEQHALAGFTEASGFTAEERCSGLRAAKQCHETAAANLELAIAALEGDTETVAASTESLDFDSTDVDGDR